MQPDSSIDLTANVGDDSTATPLSQWSLTCGSDSCGTLSPATTSNFGYTVYTAPPTPPPGGTVTITATSIPDPTQSASVKTIIMPKVATLPDGNYVFQMSGSFLSGPALATGVFVAKGGSVTGGELDYITDSVSSFGSMPAIVQNLATITGGSYSVNLNGSLTVKMQYQVGATNQGGNLSFTGELNKDSTGFVPQIYGTYGAGVLEPQTSTTPLSGGYAFSLNGWKGIDLSAWMGGIFNVDSPGTVSGAGSVFDLEMIGDGNEWTETAKQIGASTVSEPDQYGRVQIQLNSIASTYAPSLSLAGYLVDGHTIQLMETAGDDFAGDISGVAISQGASTGHFTPTTVTGDTFVVALSGFLQNAPYQSALALTPNSDGTLSYSLIWASIPNPGGQAIHRSSGTWTIDPAGRLVISNLMDGPTAAGSSFDYTLELYLTGDGNALVLSADSSNLFAAGQAYERQAGNLSALSGSFGLNAAQTYYVADSISSNVASGPLTFTPAGNADSIAGIVYTFSGDATYSGSFTTSADGILEGTVTGLNPVAPNIPDSYAIFPIDNSRAVFLQTDLQQLTLGLATSQQ